MTSKAGFQREHVASKKHPQFFQQMTKSDYEKQFKKYDSNSSWTFNPYLGLGGVLLLGAMWYNGQFAGRNSDMLSVPVPGFGDVKADKLFDRTNDLYAKGGKLDS